MRVRLEITALFLAAVLVAGCKTSITEVAASSGKINFPPLPGTFTTAEIHDPSFDSILAEKLTIPAGWNMDGTIMQSPCTTVPWDVYRAYSRDGLREMRQMPTLGWRWSPRGYANLQGCLDLRSPVSAAAFLSHFLASMPSSGFHVVGPMPVPAAFQQWARGVADRQNSLPVVYEPARFFTTADTAAYHIQTHNGTFIIDQRLKAVVICSVNNHAGAPLEGGNCWARVDVLRAPEGHLDELVRLVDANQLPKAWQNPEWQQKVLARDREELNAGAQKLFAMQRAQAAASKAMSDQFMATMQRNHQAFMQQQEDNFNHFQANIAAQQQARDNSASDWVDFALDRQTVAGPQGISKVSSDYTHVWTSQSGNDQQYFMTNDPNANPNGVLGGDWSENTKVHGNGQPY
ncbi:MAG: hypothetical protein ABR956_06545 [Terracidiphilus sp.]|jgi:hypothetical protein